MSGQNSSFIREKREFCGASSLLTQEEMKSLDYEAMVKHGKELISKLPRKFLDENQGKFLAVGLKSGKVLAIKNSLEEMHQELARNRPKEDYLP